MSRIKGTGEAKTPLPAFSPSVSSTVNKLRLEEKGEGLEWGRCTEGRFPQKSEMAQNISLGGGIALLLFLY